MKKWLLQLTFEKEMSVAIDSATGMARFNHSDDMEQDSVIFEKLESCLGTSISVIERARVLHRLKYRYL